jgi:hypothetical protein
MPCPAAVRAAQAAEVAEFTKSVATRGTSQEAARRAAFYSAVLGGNH